MRDIVANERDGKLLGKLDLELLSQEIVGHGEALAELVGQHNDRLVALFRRHDNLADARRRLVDFDVWADAKLDDVVAERARVSGETWDWLQALRAELARREAILARAENILQGILTDVAAQRERTAAKLTKSMAGTRRGYVEASPARGEYHFAEVVDSDNAIVAMDQQRARLKSNQEWVVDHRRRANHGQSMVVARQEEVFAHLLH